MVDPNFEKMLYRLAMAQRQPKGQSQMRQTFKVLSIFALICGAASAKDTAAEVADFLASDLNNNKVLEGDEFKTFIKRRAIAGNSSSKWVVRFGAWGRALRTVDTNGDKIVTPAELRAFDAKD
jgi:hypothetical protein